MNTLSPFLTVHLSDNLTQQRNHFSEAISNVINEDTDMFIVTKDQQKIPCHKYLLSLFSPLVARIVSEIPSCASPTIFLPDFTSNHISKLLDILKSGKTFSGEKSPDDLRFVHAVAKVLKISITDLSIEENIKYDFESKMKDVENDKILQFIEKSFDSMNKLLNKKEDLNNTVLNNELHNDVQKDELDDTVQQNVEEKGNTTLSNMKQEIIHGEQKKLKGCDYLKLIPTDKIIKQENNDNVDTLPETQADEKFINHEKENRNQKERIKVIKVKQENIDENVYTEDVIQDKSIKRKNNVSIANSNKKIKVKQEIDEDSLISPNLPDQKIRNDNSAGFKFDSKSKNNETHKDKNYINKSKNTVKMCNCGQDPEHPEYFHKLLINQNILKQNDKGQKMSYMCKCRKLPEHPPFHHKILSKQNLLKPMPAEKRLCMCDQIPEHTPFLHQLLEDENLLKPRPEERQKDLLCECGQLPQHGQFIHNLLVKDGTILR